MELLGGIDLNKGINLYADKGIEVSGEKMYAGQKVTLAYRGLLAASGADRVFVHYGYGDSWDSSELVEMDSCDGGFKADINLTMPGTLNICFKDSAGNWDNNSNDNYSFKILAKRTAVRTKKTISAV